ncbi:malto-oligosyltrehalose synthase [Dyella marensis]|uniref:malto-oligosyltrehalose synthase n=1 Tax=Dyella marensis TaxID=500610 RepID=UPI0031D366C0
MKPWTATARLQLRPEFDLRAAAAQVPYYAALGISHLYLSPIAQARTGSTHGYDAVDPTRVSAALGGEEALAALVEALHAHGMGLLLDIVPNHMAASVENPWWRDVLQHGRESRYAGWFDIDWSSPEAEGRVWLPVLAKPLAEVLDEGGLTLTRAGEADSELAYGELRLPLAQGSLEHLRSLGLPLDLPLPPAAMRRLLELQHYRPAWWRSGPDVINYRRFFDIDALVALDMDHGEAFDAVHALPLALIARGWVDGLRVDHVDGIACPRLYLRRLRTAMDEAAAQSGRPAQAVRLYVEKILAPGETLPRDWPVEGSTGYDAMDLIGAVQHDPRGHAALARLWQACTGHAPDFRREERRARRLWLRYGLRSDFIRCLRQWETYLATQPEDGDLSAAALARALYGVLARLPVYRSYLGPAIATAADSEALVIAFERAARDGRSDDRPAREWLRRQLLERVPSAMPGLAGVALKRARQRFEQLAAPLCAKAVEDTAGYRYGVLLSRNEVGSDPAIFALAPEAFHAAMQRRAGQWPHSLNATATHDHKRGEDTRARLAVLSELAGDWSVRADAWIRALQARCSIDAGDLSMLLQTIVAAWPLELQPRQAAVLAAYRERIHAWWMKALREARLRTSWTAPDEACEGAAQALLQELFVPDGRLLHEIAAAAHELDVPGAAKGLATVVLRNTMPGLPDLYQGTDYWDQSLVDPDNRRAVDYAARSATAAAETPVAELLERFRDGAIKQWLLARLLHLRRRVPVVFDAGGYRPVPVEGAARERVLAFERRCHGHRLVVAVPHLCADWLRGACTPRIPQEHWGDGRLRLEDPPPGGFIDALDGRRAMPGGAAAGFCSALFAQLPLAVLYAQDQEAT